MDITPVTSFYTYVFNRIGETGSFLINTGAAFNTIPNVLMVALLPHSQVDGIGTIPETSFKVLIRGSDLVLPPKMSDRIIFRGKQYTFTEQDPVSLSINGTVVAYSLIVSN